MQTKTTTARRCLSILAALVLVLAAFGATLTPARAAGTSDGKITIQKTVTGETYKVYKVFDATTNNASATNGATGKNISYTYTSNPSSGTTDAFLTVLQGTESPFTVTETSATNVYNVTLKEGKKDSGVITFLNSQVNNLGTPVNGENGTKAEASTTGSQTGNDITIEDLAYGYYYITTTTGSAVTINSAAKEVTVEDKNSVPSVDKKQTKDSGETKSYADTDLNAKIGDTIYYQIIVTAGKANDKDITITDTLSDGLSLDVETNTENEYTVAGAKITDKNGTEISKTDSNNQSNYTFTVDKADSAERIKGFTLKLMASYVKTLSENDQIVITYSAHLNKDAVTGTDASEGSTAGNTNTVKLEYSQQTTTDTTTVYTYDFDLVKTDSSKVVLSGAKFKLYPGTAGTDDSVTKTADAKAIQFVKVDATANAPETYRVATPDETKEGSSTTTTDTIPAGYVRISGLDNGTYALEETEAPAGYNKLTAPVKVTVKDANNRATIETTTGENAAQTWKEGGVHVTNNAGSALPSAGGIGTTIFYVLGGALIAAAVVLLLVKKYRGGQKA